MDWGRLSRLAARGSAARWLRLLLALVILVANLGLAVPPSAALAQDASGKGHQEGPAVGYATDASRTLIRWIWNRPEHVDGFRVLRSEPGGQPEELAVVGPVYGEAEGMALLDSWPAQPGEPSLSKRLMADLLEYGVQDISSLHGFLAQNPFMAAQLANAYYPVAELIGWGYRDTRFTAGVSYTYEVIPVIAGQDGASLGRLTLTAGQPTPLAGPTQLQAVDLAAAGALAPAGVDWAAAQKNRRFDRAVYLLWEPLDESNGAEFPAAWPAGYDIYRAPIGSSAFAQVNGDRAVQPMPARIPEADAGLPVDMPLEFFYQDTPPAYGSYEYRVAARDLLGRPRPYDPNSPAFSAVVSGQAQDFMPPPGPAGLSASVNATNDAVELSWAQPEPGDATAFVIEQALGSPTGSWQAVYTTPSASVLSWADTNPTQGLVRWYRVSALDAAGNKSVPAGPVQAVINDISGPDAERARISVEPCDPANPNGSSSCIDVTMPPDTTRIQIFCALSPGGEFLPMAELPGASVDNFDLTSVYAPPMPLENISCKARPVDGQGNLGGFSQLVILPYITLFTPWEAPRPLITDIATALSNGNWQSTISWDVPFTTGLASFTVSREQLDTAEVVQFDVGPAERSFVDDGVAVGVTYTYTVSARLKPNLPYFGKVAHSQPRIYKVLADGERALSQAGWDELSHAGSSTTLRWAEDPDYSGQRPWAVFRSVRRDGDYIQLTPVLTNDRRYYIDNQAGHNRYWYVVVEYDPFTGEPARFTLPRSVAYGQADPLPGGAEPATPAASSGLVMPAGSAPALPQAKPCTPRVPDPNKPLRFAGGFEVELTQYALLSGNVIMGSGQLYLSSGNKTIKRPVTITAATVGNKENYVCTGSLTVDLGANGGVITRSGPGLRYQVQQLAIYPWYPSQGQRPASGRLLVELPQSLRARNAAGGEFDALLLNDALVTPNLSFSYTLSPSQPCGDALAFNLESLPVQVRPSGTLTLSGAGLTMAASCMQFLDRLNPNYGARPAPGSPTIAADSNDGFLRGLFKGGAVSITSAGLAGGFSSDSDMSWLASAPYGTAMSVTGPISVTIAESRIAGGQLGAGSFSMPYRRAASIAPISTVAGSFKALPLDALGGGATATTSGAEIKFMFPLNAARPGFRLQPGSWELYIPGVTSAGRPAFIDAAGKHRAAAWEPRATGALDLGDGAPALLEAGLNRRVAAQPLIWGNCGSPLGEVTFSARQDTYLRLGGVSQQHYSLLPGDLDLPIYTYDTTLKDFDLSFLDNTIVDSNVPLELRLPAPAGFQLDLYDTVFSEAGCIIGADVPPAAADKTLAHWQVGANFRAVEFRDQIPDAASPEWTKVLWAIGRLAVPHLSPLGQPGAGVPAELAFHPKGFFLEAQMLAERPEYELDGFTFLLEGVRLSKKGTGVIFDPLDWAEEANFSPAPDADWYSQGFVELKGRFVTPYFGPLAGTDGTNQTAHPLVYVLGWDNYVGFSSPLSAQKQWTDQAPMAVTLSYPLVYAQHGQEARGALVGYDAMTFKDADQNDALELDTAIVLEPQGPALHVGLAAGVGALRAVELATGAQPSDALIAGWAAQLGLPNLSGAGSYLDLYALARPAFNGGGHADTTAVLNGLDSSLPAVQDVGARSLGTLYKQGFDLLKLRGAAGFSGGGMDRQLDGLELRGLTQVHRDGEAKPMFSSDRLGLAIDRHGNFVLENDGAQASALTSGQGGAVMYEDELGDNMKLTLRIDPLAPQLEGGFEARAFYLGTINVTRASAVVGVGAEVNYIGASFDAVASFGPGPSSAMGGSFLVGTVDTQSQILQGQYPDLMARLNGDTGQTKVGGFYLRVYGDFPVYSNGCVLQLNAGGEVAMWYFTAGGSQGDYYGGKLRGYLYGDVLCIGSARGDLSLTYANSAGSESLSGSLWVAAGIGGCDPEYWKSWGSRWWDDAFCLTGGASADVFLNDKGNLDMNLEFDLESPI